VKLAPLTGIDFRVFRSLANEGDQDTVALICVRLSRQPVEPADVEAALERLASHNYVREYRQGHWELGLAGLGCRRTLLSERHAA
jgi:hypothetical protein